MFCKHNGVTVPQTLGMILENKMFQKITWAWPVWAWPAWAWPTWAWLAWA